MLAATATPEGDRGVALADRGCGDAAQDGRDRGACREGSGIHERWHHRVLGGCKEEFLFPGDEHAVAGRASGNGNGYWPRPGAYADSRGCGREVGAKARGCEVARSCY